MTLSEHIQRLTSKRYTRNVDGYHLTLVSYHDAIHNWMRNRVYSGMEYLPSMFERFVSFFAEVPEEVNVEETLKLGKLDARELERIREHPGFDLFHLSATLHAHVSEAYDAYIWLKDPYAISPAGPYEEDGFYGVPVSFARAVNTVVAYAEKRSIDLSARLDEAVASRSRS
jgi:hypothetical protein